ncbi:hypothetical protein SEA_BRAN_58 [Corynebacterium phage Bran]|nr:hypothetical protein SEA_BRAN_58 [Corynebacterium phage Bran]
MKHLSPMDAQRRLSYARKHGIHMSAEHRLALETIAGMRDEWGVSCEAVAGPTTFKHSEWVDSDGHPLTHHTAWLLARGKERAGYENVRIVRRYTIEPEEP